MRLTFLAKLAFAAVVLLATAQTGLSVENYVQWTDTPGAFAIVDGSHVAPILVDPSDWPGVTRAAADLRDDIKRVTGKDPPHVAASLPDASAGLGETGPRAERGPHPIIIGTLGHSPLIDGLVTAGKIDTAPIKGKWESFIIQVVPHALPDAQS